MVGRKGSSVGREMENNTKVFGSEISFFCHSCIALLVCLSQMFIQSEIVIGMILNTGCQWKVFGPRDVSDHSLFFTLTDVCIFH